MFRLFDVSHFNARCDFVAAKAGGFDGAYLKATDGASFTDPLFAVRRAAAKAAGVPVGAYLFLRPDDPIAEQVARFVDVVSACDPLELRVALDHETASSRGPAASAAAARNAAALLALHFGYAPLLYTYPSFITEGHCAGLDGFPLWIASYNQTATPALPGVWSDWALWQTGQGVVPGVAGGDGPGTDLNVCRDLAVLRAPAPVIVVPDPTPAPSPEGDEVAVDQAVIITTPQGANHRPAALLDVKSGRAAYLSSAQWQAMYHQSDRADPAVSPPLYLIRQISVADHDAYTGGPK